MGVPLLKVDLVLAAVVVASAGVLDMLLILFDEGGVGDELSLGVGQVVGLEVEEFLGGGEHGDRDRMVS